MDESKRINVWYDNAWPHLDVRWGSGKAGAYMAPTAHEDLDVRVDVEGNALGFMLTGIRHLKGQTLTGSLQQVAVDEKTWSALHHKPVGPSNVRLPEYCGVVNAEGIHFQSDYSGDCIEVRWGAGEGHYAPTADDRVKALLDSSGNIIGFTITGISQMGEGEKDFINVDLYPAKQSAKPANPNS